jgi:hypothetical protein
MELLIVPLVLVAVVGTNPVSNPDMSEYNDCKQMEDLIFHGGDCTWLEGFQPCQPEKITEDLWKTKCGEAWKKLNELGKDRWYCNRPNEVCANTGLPTYLNFDRESADIMMD